MAPLLDAYSPHPRAFRNQYLQNPSNLRGALPATDDLITLKEQLNTLKTRTTERLDKATRDVDKFQAKWAEMTRERERPKEQERVRDKAKARIKREASETPSVDEFVIPDVRPRHTSTSVRKSDADRKKKRKRDDKRSSVDPDLDILTGINRLSPSPVALPPERPQKKLKPSHFNHPAQLTIPPPPPGPPVDPNVATDFSLPEPAPFTLRPTLGLWGKNGLLQPGTRHAYEVMDDFTNTKAPQSQTPVSTFWKETETWMKNVGEEDVTFLGFTNTDTDAFTIPKLGKHYSEVWEEQEKLLLATQQSLFPEASVGINGTSFAASNGSTAPLDTKAGILNNGTSDTLTDADLPTEKKSLGPFTERILSALLAESGALATLPESKPTSEELAPPPSGSTAPAPSVTPTPVSFYDLETRLRLELKACGLLGAEEPDFAESYDDDIASALRELQHKLQRVKTMNDLRKERLSAIARDRLAYLDYQELLDDLGRQIGAGYQRILKANQKLQQPKKKKLPPGATEKEKERNAALAEAAAEAARLKTLVLEVPEGLSKLVEIRRQFKEAIGKAMLDWEARQPGRLIGAPTRSIYEGLKLPDGSEYEDDLLADPEPPLLHERSPSSSSVAL
ncbi:hypothetical protein DL93DRAFT_2164651 [Clavulina sp. PMI_390]|nr:hypothetical protein DL93DRAFT_2164651 [Clavulina sp. PMI_390]